MLAANIIARPLLSKTAFASASASASASAAYIYTSSTYTCLSCQLRGYHDALSSLEGAEKKIPARKTSPNWKHIYPQGRVVGKGNKRQRVVSVDLTRKSLDKPSSVVVLHDFAEEKDAVKSDRYPPTSFNSTLSARDIEDEIAGRRKNATEAEVNHSIDDLKPSTSLLAEEEFNKLIKGLITSYSLQQLSGYLLAATPAPRTSGSLGNASKSIGSGAEVSPWRPGETPIAQRHQIEPKVRSSGRKERTAQSIVRQIWNCRLLSEEQEIGELDIRLLPWQLSMLFNSTHDGVRGYDKFLSAGLADEVVRFESYHPDGIARITGRRHDAEDTAAQLQAGLSSMTKVVLDMQSLGHTVSKLDLGHDVLAKEVRRVAELTDSTIEPLGDSSYAIYSRTEAGANHAHRLLLTLLHMSKDIVDAPEATLADVIKRSGQMEQIQADRTTSSLHQHVSTLPLTRTVEARRSTQPSEAAGIDAHVSTTRDTPAADVLALLNQRGSSHVTFTPKPHVESYWTSAVRNHTWTARFGRLLRTPSLRLNDDHAETANDRLIFQPLYPGLEHLLSYFKPVSRPRPTDQQFQPLLAEGDPQKPRRDRGAAPPFLKAYFLPTTPKPNALAALPLPKLQLSFDSTSSRGLELINIEAVLDTTDVPIPLPDRAVDLVFSSSASVFADVERAVSDKNIRDFVHILAQSVLNGDGALSAPRELTVRLPHWMLQRTVNSKVQSGAIKKEDVPVTYLLERFEQIQELDLIPNPQAKGTQGKDSSLVQDFGNNLRLCYKDVEGGMVYGSRTELSLRLRPDKDEQLQTAEDTGVHTAQLVGTALRLTTLLDQATVGGSGDSAKPERADKE